MKRCIWLLLLALVTGGCARKHRRAQLPRPPGASSAGAAQLDDVLYGYASWYGHPYHGRRTASGEIYDMHTLTAAHRTMSFGTRVEVTNVENGRKVRVRINDRGPFVEGRLIDLSYAAASAIEMIGPGTALVRLSVVEDGGPSLTARYTVQVGAFHARDHAERLRHQLAGRHAPVRIRQEGDLYRVLVGAENSEAAADSLARQLRQEHLLGFVILLP